MTSLLLVCVLSLPAPAVLAQTLRIGVYHNPPKLLLDDEGQLSGMLGDLLSAIAEEEGWALEPVPCIWNDCLAWLESGRIDLMPDVALTESRDERFDFHRVPALLSWSQVFEVRGLGLSSLLDLQARRVAVLQGSVQEEYLRQLAESFELNVDWVLVNRLEQGFEAVAQGRADAVATNHFLGELRASELNLNPTPILFQPSKLFFAATDGRHGEVLAAIDAHLQSWRADPDSRYFDIMRRWGVAPVQPAVPVVIWWALATLLGMLVLLLGFSQLLRRQVAERTRSLHASESRLRTILDSVDAYIYIKDRDLRYQYVNRKVCELFQLPESEILGQGDERFFDANTLVMLRRNDLKVIELGERVSDEEFNLLADERAVTMLSAKIPLRDADGGIYALCGISTDITEHRQIQDELHQLAFFDPLTGLANRRLLLDRLRHAFASYAQTGYEGALLVIDLDNFKTLNDTLGHHVGDKVLQQVAQRLRMLLRSTDTAGRLGADEFVMILEDLSSDPREAVMRARDVAQNILDVLAKPFLLGEQPQYVTTSAVGVAMFSDVEESVDALLKGADLALFAAKTSGRNMLHFFNPAMQQEVNRRSRIESALRGAIESNELQLHVQPQVDARGVVVGVEALVRWQSPTLGWVSPGEFIPIAESSGLIIEVGEWVLAEACRVLARWHGMAGLAELSMAVNISPRQFRHAAFVDHLKRVLHETGIPPARLELEITESLLIDDLENTIERMQQLRSQGVRFSLDDFGTGYASLGYLKRMPLYQLKIDQSFVRELLTDANDEAIVRAIIALGRSLELQVIAEGVETKAQAQRLRELGCNLFQGYYFGKPDRPASWEQRLLHSLHLSEV